MRFNSLEDAVEAVEFLARLPLPRGRNIAIMTSSGALRELATETAERVGATLATLSESTKDALNAILGEKGASNPFDTKRTIPAAQYAKCVDVLVDAPEVDIVLVAEDMLLDKSVERRAGNILSIGGASRRAASIGRTVAMFTPLTVCLTDYGRSVRAQIVDVPVMRETERTLRVVDVLARAGMRPIHSGPFFIAPADTDFARRWRERATTLDRATALNEVESKLLLGAYGIALPPERFVRTADDAIVAAHQVGFPVVLKAVSAALPHKSDAGLVRLNLTDDGAVRQAAAEITARTTSLPVPLDGMLVARHVSGGTEVVLGVQRDVEMGPVVMFGMGGVLVELFKDVSFAPATLDQARAREMIMATRAGRLLEGFRGHPPGDLDALCNALVSLGRLARELGDVIESVDVNPLLVRERGVLALDGLVVLRPPAAK